MKAVSLSDRTWWIQSSLRKIESDIDKWNTYCVAQTLSDCSYVLEIAKSGLEFSVWFGVYTQESSLHFSNLPVMPNDYPWGELMARPEGGRILLGSFPSVKEAHDYIILWLRF